MDAITDPSVQRVTVMKSARVGYTKILNHIIGYHVHQDPCPIMVVQPTVEDAEGYSKDEIAPMLRDTPALQGVVSDPRSRDSTNTIRKKVFPGGQLLMVGANSPGGFRRVSIRVILFDEVDGYPPSAGAEGDQIKLGERRTEYYWNRKIVMGSTPTLYETSRVRRSFERSDMRRYFVPCPHCDHYQVLRWDNMRWEPGKPETARYACEACGCLIEHKEKRRMIERGEWRATKPFNGHAGFHIWAGYSYSPNATWEQLVAEWESIRDEGERKTFINTVLGECYEDDAIKLDEDALRKRAEPYPADLPDGVVALTMGVDVQDDRLEYEVVGWAVGRESWGIQYGVILGRPSQPEVWTALDAILARQWTFADGVRLQIARACVDSGGHYTTDVYRYCSPREGRGVLAIKGRGGDGLPLIVGKPSKIPKYRVHLFHVAANTAKEATFTALGIEEGPGRCHFPSGDGRGYDDTYYKGLMAEERILRYRNGQPYYAWEKKRGGVRNEPLDCRNYATAALEIMQPHFPSLEAELATQHAAAAAGNVAPPTPPPRKRRVLSRGMQ